MSLSLLLFAAPKANSVFEAFATASATLCTNCKRRGWRLHHPHALLPGGDEGVRYGGGVAADEGVRAAHLQRRDANVPVHAHDALNVVADRADRARDVRAVTVEVHRIVVALGEVPPAEVVHLAVEVVVDVVRLLAAAGLTRVSLDARRQIGMVVGDNPVSGEDTNRHGTAAGRLVPGLGRRRCRRQPCQRRWRIRPGRCCAAPTSRCSGDWKGIVRGRRQLEDVVRGQRTGYSDCARTHAAPRARHGPWRASGGSRAAEDHAPHVPPARRPHRAPLGGRRYRA